MGAGQSLAGEQRPPTMVFRGESDIPIRFSADLINSLEKWQKHASSSGRPPSGAAEAADAGKPAGAPSAEFTNAEIERRVAELVAVERARLEEREKAVARFEDGLIDSALAKATPASPAAPTPGDGRSVSIVAQDVEELMRRNKLIIVKPPNPAIAKTQQDVVECYRTKVGRPLDCWREVEGFRASVRTAQQEFVSNHA